MADYFAVLGGGSEALSESDVRRCLDPSGRTSLAVWRGPHAVVAARAGCMHTVASGEGDWRIWFVGELPTANPPPWEALVRAVSEGDDGGLGRMNGWFAALVIHEPSGKAWAVSDRRAQQPSFHYEDGETLYVSSAAAAFCRLPKAPAFDRGWLFETIYFNHPVLDRSFLEGVSRVPPASIMGWQPGDNRFRTRSWAIPFGRPERLATGQDADALERETFRAVASDHFEPGESLAVALTGGFDSRAALAAAPRRANLVTYTYALPGGEEIMLAAQVAARLGLEHFPIQLDDRFVENIPAQMVAAVRDSDGLERVLRAELLAVYPALSNAGRTMVVGGVSGDHIFRDHPHCSGNVPYLISSPMMSHIHGQGAEIDSETFVLALGKKFEPFGQHIRASLEGLHERHGDLRQPEGYLRYLVYENAPKHFGGEAALASNYLRFRPLYWDPRLVGLGFVTERGTIGLSERGLTKHDDFLQNTVQARIIRDGEVYGGGKVHGIRASTWASGNAARFRLEQFFARTRRYARVAIHGRPPGLLSWPSWLAGPARELCEELLGPEARLRQHLDGAFLDGFVPTSDLRLAGRLLSAELVLRLLENGWPPDFRVNGAG